VLDARPDVRDDLPSIYLVPAPIKRLSDKTELDDEVVRQFLRFDFASLLPPKLPPRASELCGQDIKLSRECICQMI